jgi:hypothetical protein
MYASLLLLPSSQHTKHNGCATDRDRDGGALCMLDTQVGRTPLTFVSHRGDSGQRLLPDRSRNSSCRVARPRRARR